MSGGGAGREGQGAGPAEGLGAAPAPDGAPGRTPGGRAAPRDPRPPRRRAPVPVAGAVNAFAASLEPLTTLSAVRRAWPEVAGAVVAAEAQPVSERGGVVTIACRSAVWAQELTLLAPDLVARLNEALGGPRVAELRCTAGPRRGGR